MFQIRRLNACFAAWCVSVSCFAHETKTICVDPGHPSEVGSGTHGRKTTEIAVAYRAAQLLSARLKSEGYKVVLTKLHENEKVTNQRRAEIANEAHADLFIRLHCDSAKGSGFTVYYPSREGVTAAGVRGPSASVIRSSSACAHRLYSAMCSSLSGKFSSLGLKSDDATAIGSHQGALTGSIFSKVPTVLIEMIVLTNPSDEKWILSREGMTAMVEALDQGVRAAVSK